MQTETWFKAATWRTTPEMVQVEASTDKTVKVRGRTHHQRTGSEAYFRTEREALEWAREHYQQKVAGCERSLQAARSRLGEVESALKKLPC